MKNIFIRIISIKSSNSKFHFFCNAFKFTFNCSTILRELVWGNKIKQSICKGIGIYLLFKRLLDNNETHSVRQRGLSSESEII